MGRIMRNAPIIGWIIFLALGEVIIIAFDITGFWPGVAVGLTTGIAGVWLGQWLRHVYRRRHG